MPTRRRTLRRDPRFRLTLETVRLFRLIEEIRDAGDDAEKWETEGGRRRQYLDAEWKLRHMLGLAGHAISPCDPELAAGRPRPDYMRDLASGATWGHAVELRRALLAAAAVQRAAEAAELAKVLRAPARRRAKPPQNPQGGTVSAPEGELPENEPS